jgi:hypothetical protein
MLSPSTSSLFLFFFEFLCALCVFVVKFWGFGGSQMDYLLFYLDEAKIMSSIPEKY